MKKYPQLVSTALDLFYRQGFHATGVDQLAAAAGLTKKTLYRYFPTKEALIEAVLQQRDEQFMARLQAFVEPLPAPQRPAGYLRFIGAWSQERDFQGCLFINAAAEYPELSHAIHLQAARHKARLRQWLLALCEQAALPDAPAAAARLFLLGEGLTVGAQVQGFDAQLLEAACAQLTA